MRKIWASRLLVLALLVLRQQGLWAYQGGALRNHGHGSTAGDGGLLSNLVVGGGLKASSGAFVVDGAGASVTLPSGVTLTAPNIAGTVTLSTITLTGFLSGVLNASTGTFIPPNANNLSNTAMGACVTGSTITLVTNSSAKHMLLSNVNVRGANAGDHIQCGVLQNGAYFEQQNSARGLWVGHPQGTPSWTEFALSYLTQSLYPAGTYNYCITCAITANSFQFCSNADATQNQTCTFNAGEHR